MQATYKKHKRLANQRLQSNKMEKVAVLGAGAWGTALATHLAKAGHVVTLWSYSAEDAQQMNAERENIRYLAGFPLPANLHVTSDFTMAIQQVDAILVVVPSSAFHETFVKLQAANLEKSVHIAWATKGLEPESKRLLHEIAEELLPDNNGFTVLSGPTFAVEVAKGLPTAIVSASPNKQEAKYWASVNHYHNFRAYTQTDITGVEVGGAYKNIIAIATGISDGLGMGANAKAAIISRGMAEITRFGQKMGADPVTLMGLAGLGDLVLTCNDDLSRNRRFGMRMAKGNTVEQVEAEIGQVVEGVKAVKIINELAKTLDLDLPIAKQVYKLVSGKITTRQAVTNLLARSSKSESI